MNRKRFLKVSAACASVLAALNLFAGVKTADAAKIYLNDNELYSYKVGLEWYLYGGKKVSGSKPIAVEIEADDFAGGYVEKPYTITFTLESESTFSPGTYHLIDEMNNVYAVGSISSETNKLSLINNDDLYGNGETDVTRINFGKKLYLKKLINVVNGVKVYGDPTVTLAGKEASCDVFPSWSITFEVNGGSQGKISLSRTFASVEKTVNILPGEGNVNARLDPDRDLKEFIVSTSYPLSYVEYSDTISSVPVLRVEKKIVDFDGLINASTTLSFNLESMYPEPAVKEWSISNVAGGIQSQCNTSDNTVWTCALNTTFDKIVGSLNLTGKVNKRDIINPTIWTLKNFNLSISGLSVCYSNLFPKDLGTWRGGLEVVIPFVRVNESEQAATTIVFTNRSNQNLKIYASLWDDDKKLVIPTTLIGEIPAKDTVRITWMDLKNAFGSNPLLSKGTSMKVMIMAPVATEFGDSYVQVYVVYSYAGQQRYIPVEVIKNAF